MLMLRRVLVVFAHYLLTKWIYFRLVIIMHTLTIFRHENDVLLFHLHVKSWSAVL